MAAGATAIDLRKDLRFMFRSLSAGARFEDRPVPVYMIRIDCDLYGRVRLRIMITTLHPHPAERQQKRGDCRVRALQSFRRAT